MLNGGGGGVEPAVWKAAGLLVAAAVGRMVYLSKSARRRGRRIWGLHLLWEIPVVLAGYFVALAAAEYFTLGHDTARLVAVVAGYLGPGGVEALVCAWLKRRDGIGGPT